jgi:hypothetical protein
MSKRGSGPDGNNERNNVDCIVIYRDLGKRKEEERERERKAIKVLSRLGGSGDPPAPLAIGSKIEDTFLGFVSFQTNQNSFS